MATSTMIPTICPICARDFTLELPANIPPHVAGHLAVYFVKTVFGKTPEEASTDW